MDTEKQLMEQLQQLQEQNKELLAGANVLNARNKELVDFIKDILKDIFNNEIGHVDFERERVTKTNKVIAESYKTFSGQIHKFSEVAKDMRGDKSHEMVWDKVKEFVSEQSKSAAKEGQKAIARGVKKANQQIKEAEEMYKELTEKNEKLDMVNN